MKKYLKILLLLISLIIFYFILNFYFANELNNFDSKIYNIIISIKTNIITYIMIFFSYLCNVFVLLLIATIFYAFKKDKNHFMYMLYSLFSVIVLNQAIKFIVRRPRPSDINLIKETGFSFPSGHAMCAFAFYGLLIYIFYHSNINKKLKSTICISLLLLIGLIGISRIYLGVHYASDVMAGYALGCAYLMLFISLFKEKIIK